MATFLGAMASNAQWRAGYELIRETGLLSGTLYPLPMQMTEQGLIEAEWRDPVQLGRPARHANPLTVDGVALARRLADEALFPAAGLLPALARRHGRLATKGRTA